MEYIYEIVEGEFDRELKILLSHKKKYTEEEFKNIIKQGLKKIKSDYKKGKGFFMIWDLIDILIEQDGFERYKTPEIHIQASVSDDRDLMKLLEEE